MINAGDGAGQHPSQTLLDLYTIRKSMPIDGVRVGLLGDLRYGRTTHSLAMALSLYGAEIAAVAPKGLELPSGIVRELADRGTSVTEYSAVEDVIADLDVLYVTRIQRERFPDAASYLDVASSYRITPELVADARESMIILHPLPRVDEIDPRVDTLPNAKYFEQAHHGVSCGWPCSARC